MPRRGRAAAVGGSFDHFHAGHKALLDAAFAEAASVGVGVSTDRFLKARRKPHADRLQGYARRRASVVRYLNGRYPSSRWWITPLDDAWGRSVEAGVDVLVASAETARGARLVNAERRRRGLRPLRLRLVPLVRGEDGLVVSARRIRARAIDAEGHRRRPLLVALVTAAGPAHRPLSALVTAALPSVSLRRTRVPRPRGARAGTGRRESRRAALDAAARADYGLALVAGDRGTWVALAREAEVVGDRLARTDAGIGEAVRALFGRARVDRKVIRATTARAPRWRRTSA